MWKGKTLLMQNVQLNLFRRGIYANGDLGEKIFFIGRISHVPPSSGEDFYLRLLFNVQKGCKSYNDIRTVNYNIYSTFQEVCTGFIIR